MILETSLVIELIFFTGSPSPSSNVQNIPNTPPCGSVVHTNVMTTTTTTTTIIVRPSFPIPLKEEEKEEEEAINETFIPPHSTAPAAMT